MMESELVEGQEYEGFSVDPRVALVRGMYLKKYAPFTMPDTPRLMVGLWDAKGEHAPLAWLDTLRPVSPVVEPAKVAEGDRLFETGCCLCGSPKCASMVPFGSTPGATGILGKNHANNGYRTCNECRRRFLATDDWSIVDREITRRKSLAANAQKLVSGSVKTCPGEGGYACKPGCDICAKEAIVEALTRECQFCGATVHEKHADGCHALTADDLAWALRRETLAAGEAKRKHYLERCKAYAEAADGDCADRASFKGTGAPSDAALARHASKLDAAIARVKPKEEEGPAYHYPHWPEADESEP